MRQGLLQPAAEHFRVQIILRNIVGAQENLLTVSLKIPDGGIMNPLDSAHGGFDFSGLYAVSVDFDHRIQPSGHHDVSIRQPLAHIAGMEYTVPKHAGGFFRQMNVSPEEWKAFLTQLLSDTKMNPWYSSSVKADIYVAENDSDRLFSLLMDKQHHNLDIFDKYAVHVGDEHSSKILTEYVVMLKDFAAHNMGPKSYVRIRHAMDSMLKIKNGKQVAHQLAGYFRETYRRSISNCATWNPASLIP